MKVVVIQIADELSSTAEAMIRQVQGLELEDGAVAEIATAPEQPVTNKQRVEALSNRCQRAGVAIQTKNVIELTGIDESTFYKWQAGQKVSAKSRQRCEEVVALSADEFIRRLIETERLPVFST